MFKRSSRNAPSKVAIFTGKALVENFLNIKGCMSVCKMFFFKFNEEMLAST